MDMIMVDVTTIKCNETDEVIIYDGLHTASSLAQSVNTISYEIITTTSRRIKRVVQR
jgi:alanine racemase